MSGFREFRFRPDLTMRRAIAMELLQVQEPNIAVYGSKTCPDTRRALNSLEARQIAYEFKDVDDFPELDAYIAGLNGGKRVMPTIRINNEVFVNPSEAELLAAVETAAATS